MIIIAVCILPLIIFGIVFLNGKGLSLIAGFNAKSEEEKNKYDTIKLCKFMGKMMFALLFSMLFWIFSVWYEVTSLFVIGLALFIGNIIFVITYLNSKSYSNPKQKGAAQKLKAS